MKPSTTPNEQPTERCICTPPDAYGSAIWRTSCPIHGKVLASQPNPEQVGRASVDPRPTYDIASPDQLTQDGVSSPAKPEKPENNNNSVTSATPANNPQQPIDNELDELKKLLMHTKIRTFIKGEAIYVELGTLVSYGDNWKRIIQPIATARAEAYEQGARNFAAKYGRHLSTCITTSQDWETCNCGYHEALYQPHKDGESK